MVCDGKVNPECDLGMQYSCLQHWIGTIIECIPGGVQGGWNGGYGPT